MIPSQYKKESSYFCRFTFGQFFTILVLEIFTLFFIFYLGARYGGELLGVKQPPAPVTQTPGLPQVLATDPNVVATTQDPEVKALAKDLLQQAPTADLKQRVSEMLKESAGRKTAPLPPPARPAPAQPAPAPPAELRAAPKETPEPVIQTNTYQGRFSVQIGSYPNVEEAHTIVEGWKAKGYPAFLVSADIPGKGRWYRIRLGGFNTKEAAQAFLTRLQSKQKVDAIIVTNE